MPEDRIQIPQDQLGWINRIVGPITKKFQERAAEVQVEMREGFYKYSLRVNERCGFVKTILSRGELLSVKDFYVSPSLMLGKRILDQGQAIKRVHSRKRMIVTGSAGLGKSIFLKNFAITYGSSANFPLPLFFELRELNETKATIEDSLFKLVNLPKAFLSRQQFEYALQEGLAALLLDAFDEIDFELRDGYEREILQLCIRYPDLQIIITSRPSANDAIESWGPFEHLKLTPFNLNKVEELINKTDEDQTEKEKFIEIVRDKLFDTHESFLSTPLLALIMFLTFQVGGQIPDKLHEFYHRAFEALYYRHDNEKGHYARKRYTSLSRDEFLRMLSAVCAITYFDGHTSSPESEFRKVINSASDIENIKLDSFRFLDDLIESVCLLQKDGTDVLYTHRSFQEYFTATFILNSEVLDTFGLINRLISRQGFDNVVAMIGEMNREFIEKKWVVRWLTLFAEKMADVDCVKRPIEYARYMRFSPVLYENRGTIKFGFLGNDQNSSAVNVIALTLYNERFSASRTARNLLDEKFEQESEKIARYFAERDQLSVADLKKASGMHRVNLLEKDNDVIANTFIAHSFDETRNFLLQLKADIDARHRQKGDGFMSLIRR